MKKLAVVMAGGKGERFWPLSRENHPKQFLKIAEDKELIELTFDRVRGLFDHVLVVTTKRLEEKVKERFKDVSIIAEPVGKNTAPCAAVATLFAKENGFDLVALFPADHFIKDVEGFNRNVNEALSMAKKGYIATIGIKPTRADTGFGYIERGEEVGKGIYRVMKFHEKPDAALAEEYYRSGKFYWNAGMFFWHVEVFYSELNRHTESVYLPISKYGLSSLNEIYDEMPSVSIDYALMEKTDKAVVVESGFFWEDLGSYIALERVLEKNKDGNISIGEEVVVDADNNIIIAKDGIVAAIGVNNLVIVHTEYVTLVLPKSMSQDVKKVVEILKENNKKRYL